MGDRTVEAAILQALKQYTLRSGSQLAEMTRLGAADLYPALFRLEQGGLIASEWQEGPKPRQRRYRLAGVTTNG